MKTLFIIIILFHGLLHLLGTTKSVSYLSKVQVTNVSYKLLWLSASLCFIATAALLFTQKDWWWMMALIAVSLSQYLIIKHWQIARLGSILNVLILFAAIIGFVFWKFQKTYPREIISSVGNLDRQTAGLPRPDSPFDDFIPDHG